MAARMAIDEANEKLSKYKMKIIDRYINAKGKADIICHCGRIFYASPSSIWQEQTASCGCAFLRANAKDITGMKFNYLTAIEPTKSLDNSGGVIWRWKCDCGKDYLRSMGPVKSGNTKSCGCIKDEKAFTHDEIVEKLLEKGITLCSKYINYRTKSEMICFCGNKFTSNTCHLISGFVKSCGCSRFGRKSYKDISGNKYNRLTAIEIADYVINNKVVWKFECDCGKTCFKSSSDVKKGLIKSCGCLSYETARDMCIRRNIRLGYINTTHSRGRAGASRWKRAVLIRDMSICQKCDNNSNIQIHHLNSWNKFPDQRSNIDNGIALCKLCHVEFHKKYGFGNNTQEQFLEYMDK